MNLAVFHYHLNPGGVTRVIENQLLALDAVLDPQQPWQVAVFYGGRYEGWREALAGQLQAIELSLCPIPMLDYDALQSTEDPPDPDALHRCITAALADLGQLQDGIATMRAVVEALRAAGVALGYSMLLALLAEAHGKAGQVEEGLALIADAQAFVMKTGELAFDANLHRVKGELLLARSRPDRAEAEASFREALDIARGQSAKSVELRAATSLARLWQQQGRREEARELLAPVYDWFTEGFDTRDLKDAKALLDELA